jgi:NAD(P)-dependent dehydrogenase (short-subunit alcohol dehydrogenase family)
MSAPLSAAKIFDLSGKVALVTGGGTGIGLMIARGLAANHAKVYISGRRKDVLQLAAESWKENVGAIIPYVFWFNANAYSVLELQVELSG